MFSKRLIERLAPNGRLSPELWADLLNDLGDEICRHSFGMGTLGNHLCFISECHDEVPPIYGRKIGFEAIVEDSETPFTLTTHGIFNTARRPWSWNARNPKGYLGGLDYEKLIIWGYTDKHQWLLAKFSCEGNRRDSVAKSFSGSFVKAEELFDLVKPWDLALVLRSQIDDWMRKAEEQKNMANSLKANTKDTLEFIFGTSTRFVL